MQPVSGYVFVTKAEKQQSTFDVVDNSEARYKVTHVTDVTVCKPGDFVLFTHSDRFTYNGEEVIVVNESDIRGVEVAA